MGTSVSHPSPSGSSPGGKEWGEAQQDTAYNGDSAKILDSVLGAYNAQYSTSTQDILVDSGVKQIENLISRTDFSSDDTLSTLKDFMVESRKILSEQKCNSFFAEMALMAGAKTIKESDESSKNQKFCENYLSKVVDYSVSRDMTEVVGNTGINNIHTYEKFIKDAKTAISGEVKGYRDLTDFISKKLRNK